jgi:hypothetical protein
MTDANTTPEEQTTGDAEIALKDCLDLKIAQKLNHLMALQPEVGSSRETIRGILEVLNMMADRIRPLEGKALGT